MVVVTGRLLVSGEATGPLLRLTEPISFWGGVNPVSGTISDPRHPQFGTVITGAVLAIPAAVGSSSSSAIMLELLREGTAPAAIVMGEADAILALGVVVARELGHPSIPVLELPPEVWEAMENGLAVTVTADGRLEGAAGGTSG